MIKKIHTNLPESRLVWLRKAEGNVFYHHILIAAGTVVQVESRRSSSHNLENFGERYSKKLMQISVKATLQEINTCKS